MATVCELPASMRTQWRVLEGALREQLTLQQMPDSVQATVLPKVRAAYLTSAQPVGELRFEDLETAVEDAQYEVFRVAHSLLLHLLKLELYLVAIGEGPAGWPSLPPELTPVVTSGAVPMPTLVQRQWRAFCASVRAAAGGHTHAAVAGVLRCVAAAWLEQVREMPTLRLPAAEGLGEAVVRHVGAWAHGKHLALLVAISRAEAAICNLCTPEHRAASEPARLAEVHPISRSVGRAQVADSARSPEGAGVRTSWCRQAFPPFLVPADQTPQLSTVYGVPMIHHPLVALTLDRIAVAHQLAAMAPALPGDDSKARSSLGLAVDLLGCPWPSPEGVLLGMLRITAREAPPYLAQLAHAVGSALHGRPLNGPQPQQAIAAAHVAALVSFLPGEDSPERAGLYRIAALLMDSNAIEPALVLAKDIAARCPATPIGGLAHGVALTLCAPDLETILAELRFWSPTAAVPMLAAPALASKNWH